MMNLAMRRIRGSVMNSQNDPYEMDAYRCPDHQKELLRGFIAETCRTQRSVSLCKTNSSPVTWAHYADSQRGICLGIRVNTDLIVHAKYVPEIQRIDLEEYVTLPAEDRKRITLDLMCTKSRDWDYEEEARLFFTVVDPPEGGHSYVDFGPGFMIEEVILGASCPTSGRAMRNALDRMDYKNVTLLRARKSPDQFQMICDPVSL